MVPLIQDRRPLRSENHVGELASVLCQDDRVSGPEAHPAWAAHRHMQIPGVKGEHEVFGASSAQERDPALDVAVVFNSPNVWCAYAKPLTWYVDSL